MVDRKIEGLSEGAQRMVDQIDLRHHSINLERVQRIHQDIDSEPIEFSEATIALMIQEIADNCDEDDAFTLHAVAQALRGEDDYHCLTLKQKKRGKWTPPNEGEEEWNRHMSWLYTLGKWEHEGLKTEAGIAQLAETYRVSRATVFAGIRKAEEHLAFARTLDIGSDHFKNPRPDKKRND